MHFYDDRYYISYTYIILLKLLLLILGDVLLYAKLIRYVNCFSESILKNLNRIVFLVPSYFSNVGNQSKNSREEDIEKLRSRQCLRFLKKLNELFWDNRWEYMKIKTGDDEQPLLHQITYGKRSDLNSDCVDDEDWRYLCIFQKGQPYCEPNKNEYLKLMYQRKLFTTGWKEALKTDLNRLAYGGSHNPLLNDIVKVLKYLNLKCDGNDVVIDIGYGTGVLLIALSSMLQTKVYGSEISQEIFLPTRLMCEKINQTHQVAADSILAD